jgi:type IV secretion system protein VirB10
VVLFAVGLLILSALVYGFVRSAQTNAMAAGKHAEKKVTPATAAGAELQKSLQPQTSEVTSAPVLPVTSEMAQTQPEAALPERIIVRREAPVLAQQHYQQHYPAQHVPPAPPKQTEEELRIEQARKAEEQAMQSPTAIGGSSGFADIPRTLPVNPGIPGVAPPDRTSVAPVALPEEAEPAAAKLAFLESERAKLPDHYLKAMRTAQLTPYEIKAGWEIPAILEQALNSDLPGEIKALVRAHVYDTASGRYLLIPQGARVIGKYNSRVDYGQDGLQVVWDRLIYPDGSSLDLGGMNGMDAHGNSGLRHDVDNHYRRIFGMAALSTLFSAGLAMSQSRQQSAFSYPSPADMATAAAAREMAMTGAMITRKNLNIPPTIKVPLGYVFTVRVNKDIVFSEPYHPQTAPDQERPSIRVSLGSAAGR